MGLRKLIIKNFSLINYMDIDFTPGLNVITGETGAGKTLILKAIEFALGVRAENRYLKTEGPGSVSLLIDYVDLLRDLIDEVEEDEVIIRRDISSNKKTRMYINGEIVPQGKAKEALFDLFEFHGQFSTVNLLESLYQTKLYDAFLGKDVEKLKNTIRRDLHNLRSFKKEFEKFLENQYEEEIAYIEAQLQEFNSLGLEESSEEQLKEEEKLLQNAKEIINGISFSYDLLYESEGSVNSLLALVQKELKKISTYSREVENILNRIETISIEVDDISQELYDLKERVEIDEDRLRQIEELLSKIFYLRRKYRVSDITNIISYVKELEKRLEYLLSKQEELEIKKKKIEEIENNLFTISEALSKKRRENKRFIEKEIESNIRKLGIPYAKFKIEFVENKKGEKVRNVFLTEDGSESVRFLFSANPDRPCDELSKVISGGELSRVMLAIRSVFSKISKKDKILLFDEIDQGIGERLGNIVGNKLRELAQNNQVIVVTHLSQIAKMADNHIYVKKSFQGEKTVISAKVLSETERKNELLRMVGGEEHILTLRRERYV